MCAQDKRQATGGALGGEPTHLGVATRAQVALAAWLVVAAAQADVVLGCQGAAREPHHQKAGAALLGSLRHRRRRGGKEELSEVLLMHGHGVVGIIAGIRLGAQLGADGHLRREPHYGDTDAVCY
jgi:hypothetical protein